MTRERFFTVGWNNLISLVLGIIFFSYLAAALSSPDWLDTPGFIGFVGIGLLF